MTETPVPVPFPNSYWVVTAQLLAGEHPVEMDIESFRTRLGSLLDAGIRTFIDLTEPHEMGEPAVIVSVYRRLLRQLAETGGVEITQVMIPIRDHDVPSAWTMRCILDVMDRSLADKNPVFVHCLAGLGRTGTVVGCYLKRHGLAADGEVTERIAELRKFIPEGWGPSPQTPEQIRMIQNWREGA